jgi:hypothetical protein
MQCSISKHGQGIPEIDTPKWICYSSKTTALLMAGSPEVILCQEGVRHIRKIKLKVHIRRYPTPKYVYVVNMIATRPTGI